MRQVLNLKTDTIDCVGIFKKPITFHRQTLGVRCVGVWGVWGRALGHASHSFLRTFFGVTSISNWTSQVHVNLCLERREFAQGCALWGKNNTMQHILAATSSKHSKIRLNIENSSQSEKKLIVNRRHVYQT